MDRVLGGELGGTVALAGVLGAAVGLLAWSVLVVAGEGCRLVWGGAEVVPQLGDHPWWLRLLIPALGGLACGLVVRLLGARDAGLNAAELIDDIGRRGGRVDFPRAVVRTLGSVFVVVGGGAVGPEGPIVHAGGAVGSAARALGVEGQRLRVLVACGAAAGIAAVVGAPIAGTLFAAEVLLGAAHRRALLPIAVAAAFAFAVRAVLHGAGGLVELVAIDRLPEALGPLGWGAVAGAAVLGVLAGVVGAAFGRVLAVTEEVFEAVPLPTWVLPALGGLMVGLMGLVLPRAAGHGYGGSLAELAAHGPNAVALALCLVVWRLLASSLTLGSGGAGGTLVTTLVMGGALGAAFSAGAARLDLGDPAALAGAYTFVGAVAVLAGATHAALMSVVLLFEVTREPALLLPGIVAAGAAVVAASAVSKETIHTLSLRRHGGRTRRPVGESSVMDETSVAALVTADADRIGRGEPLSKLVHKVLDGGTMYQHVVDENGKLLGTVSLQEVGPLLREDGVEGLLLAYDVMRAPPVSVTRADCLSTCMERFGHVDADELPVIDGAGVLVGRVTRKDVLAFYAREVLERRDSGMKFIARAERSAPADGSVADESSELVTDFVEVPPGHAVEGMAIPPGVVGRTLIELNLRSRFGVAVISMRRRTPGGGRISLVAPDPAMPLRAGDVVVLAGPKEQIERLRKLVGE
ncbi:MAG: chloride channel protein [Deltaproteobacteria bacterium]|nr:chloride channel protein [Deltaproteobacteria bacterium]